MLISLEGLPGSGKSTQAELLVARLRSDGYRVAYLPDLVTLDTDPAGRALVELFASTGDPFMRHRSALTDTFLAAALRAHLVAAHIQPALDEHDIVIEDRGAHTMYSYSLASILRHHRMDPDAAIDWLRSFSALTGPQADLAFWLRTPIDEAITRWSSREEITPTGDQCSFLTYVDRAYQALAARDSTMVPVDTGRHGADELSGIIYHQLHPRLPRPANA